MTTYALAAQTIKGWRGTTGQGNTPDIVTTIANVNTLAATIATDRDTDVAVSTTNTTNIATARKQNMRVPLKLTANGTWATYVELPIAATITTLGVTTPTQWASTGGGVTLKVLKSTSSGNTMLNAATWNLETISADTRTALTLTATGADLAVLALGVIYVAVISDNADATGPADGAGILTIGYTI